MLAMCARRCHLACLILATFAAAKAHALEYTAVDVDEIEAAIREFYPDPITHIGPASSRCTYTAEDPCEAETRVSRAVRARGRTA